MAKRIKPQYIVFLGVIFFQFTTIYGVGVYRVLGGCDMKIIKRSGQEVEFDIDKIIAAVRKANRDMDSYLRIDDQQIVDIAEAVTKQCEALNRSAQVEEVQDMVEDRLMDIKAFALARKYITYRFKRDLVRKVNTTDAQILALIECNSEVAKQENSNKNPTVNSVQREYMAWEVSKD